MNIVNNIKNLKVNETLIIDLIVNGKIMPFEVDSSASVILMKKIILHNPKMHHCMKIKKSNIFSII